MGELAKKAIGATGKIETGSFYGDAQHSHTINGLGFQPDHVIIINDNHWDYGGSVLLETDNQTINNFYLSGTGDLSFLNAMCITKNSDGFSVFVANAVFQNGVTYNWIAWKK